MNRRGIFSALVALVLPISVSAQTVSPQNAIEIRQRVMESVGSASDLLIAMIEDERDFDTDVVEAALQTINAGAYTAHHYFPEGSETGGDTKARPEIWQRPDEFRQIMARLQETSDAAVAAKPADIEALEEAYGPVYDECRSCHEDFRFD